MGAPSSQSSTRPMPMPSCAKHPSLWHGLSTHTRLASSSNLKHQRCSMCWDDADASCMRWDVCCVCRVCGAGAGLRGARGRQLGAETSLSAGRPGVGGGGAGDKGSAAASKSPSRYATLVRRSLLFLPSGYVRGSWCRCCCGDVEPVWPALSSTCGVSL